LGIADVTRCSWAKDSPWSDAALPSEHPYALAGEKRHGTAALPNQLMATSGFACYASGHWVRRGGKKHFRPEDLAGTRVLV